MNPIISGQPLIQPRSSTLGINPVAGARDFALPLAGSGASEPVLPKAQENAGADLAVFERRRLQAMHQAAQQIANIYVVSDTRFTIFKDVTGQYITRFTSLRDGRVTYIPEPSLLNQASSVGDTSYLNIEA